MSIGYWGLFPITPGNSFIADQCNKLRTRINQMALATGGAVTLPSIMADDSEVAANYTFHDWLLAARAALETILTRGLFRTYSFYMHWIYVWDKASVLGTAYGYEYSAPLVPDYANWPIYSANPTPNQFYRLYLDVHHYVMNELYYTPITDAPSDGSLVIPSGSFATSQVIIPCFSYTGTGDVTVSGGSLNWTDDLYGPSPRCWFANWSVSVAAGGGTLTLEFSGDGQAMDYPAAPYCLRNNVYPDP